MTWLVRGVVLCAVHVVARVLLGYAIVQTEDHNTLFKTGALAAVVLVALIWGGVDGIIDGHRHADPDDYADLTIPWLKAGVFVGIVGSVICWIIGSYWLNGMGQNGFWVEFFAGGSFMALLVFVPAFIGVGVGRIFGRRGQQVPDEYHAPTNVS